MVKISVILPVYNCEDYIREALDCLVNQTMLDDIEVIMIDDGSLDDSRYIIEEYALDFENFHAFHTQHCGVNHARNFGLKQAKGEYIHFMDADDCISNVAYEKLYDLAIKYGHDVVMGRFLRFNEKRYWQPDVPNFVFRNMDDTIESTTLKSNPQLTWDMFLWNKLYKRSFIENNNILFPSKDLTFQDNLFCIQVYVKAETIGMLNEFVYFWRKGSNSSSITQNINIKWATDRIEILKMVNKFVDENIEDEEILFNKYLKWLILDLPNFISKINEFSAEHHEFLFDSVYELVNLVPQRFILKLNSYYRVLYKMVNNKDWDDLLLLSQKNLKIHPKIPEGIKDEYKGMFNLKDDGQYEDLNVNSKSISLKDENISIKCRFAIPFFDDIKNYDELKFDCLNSKTGEILYESPIKNNKIMIPTSFIGFNDCLIKVYYKNDYIEKENYLKSSSLEIFDFEDSYLEFNFDRMGIMHITNHEKGDGDVLIEEVRFDGEVLSFKGACPDSLESVELKDSILDNAFEYDIHKKGNDMDFDISCDDLKDTPIKIWQLKPKVKFNSIKSEKYSFFDKEFRIDIYSCKNIIFIKLSRYDPIGLLSDFSLRNGELKCENKELSLRNSELSQVIEDLGKQNENLKADVDIKKSEKDGSLVNKVRKFF